MTRGPRVLALCFTIVVLMLAAFVLPATALAAPTVLTGTVEFQAGQTSYSGSVMISPGAKLVAPAGYSLTMTVNGVETGQALETTDGVATRFLPATYFGAVVFTAAKQNIVVYTPGGPPPVPTFEHPFRQALYVGATGPDWSKSVPSALISGRAFSIAARNVKITSTGECFDGIFVGEGAHYLLQRPNINLTGNGRSDFSGYGAAVVGTGDGTTLVVDGANIVTRGVARPAIVADKGANVIVKNSILQVSNGAIPADYLPTIETPQMREVPWMLSLSGNCRATNLLGTKTKASYINSFISSEGWGVLSTDTCTEPILTAINSTIKNTGTEGYGTYGIGNAIENILGCTFDVGSYASIARDCTIYYGDSDAASVAKLNTDLGLGLSAKELQALQPRITKVDSDRFGVMFHGYGTLVVSGGTQFNTKETTFLDKGQCVSITVDGSKGASLQPANGVIFQLMEDDDPGPVPGPFGMLCNGVYHEPTAPATPNATHSVYSFIEPHFDATSGPNGGLAGDAMVKLSNIEVQGSFFNAMRGDQVPAFPPGATATARNIGIFCDNAVVTGLITSSNATHGPAHMTIAYPRFFKPGDIYGSPAVAIADDYKFLGEVTNTAAKPVNNGALVTLKNGSKWNVTGDCYLTYLSIDASSKISTTSSLGMTVYVDGVAQTITPGAAREIKDHLIFIDVN